jgi:hypothetical protein
MIAFELPVAHSMHSRFVMRDIASELLTITQQLRESRARTRPAVAHAASTG